MADKSYSEKLKDPRWQKKRLEVMQRDGFKCTRCNCDTQTLHVHHIRYIEGREPWDYEIIDLTTLCEDCHEFISTETELFYYEVRSWCMKHPIAAKVIFGILMKCNKLELVIIFNMIKAYTSKSNG